MVELIVDGRINRADFEEVAAKLEKQIEQHGRVHLLEEIRNFKSIEPSVFLSDIKYALRHLNPVSRCAVV